MSTAELKQEAKSLIDTPSAARLRVASEFLAFVRCRELSASTLELLYSPGFKESFARCMKDIKAGRTKHVRRDSSRAARRSRTG